MEIYSDDLVSNFDEEESLIKIDFSLYKTRIESRFNSTALAASVNPYTALCANVVDTAQADKLHRDHSAVAQDTVVISQENRLLED